MQQRYVEHSKADGKNYAERTDHFDSLLFLDQKKLYRHYFGKLVSEYPDTKFSEEAKTECAYFNRYALEK
jgi:hypothetical protein